MSVNSKMTAIADEIRELSGTTGTMGLDAMATHIGDANTEVDNQVELLAQVVAALEGKASGGEQAAPVISVSSNGLITASAGTKSGTKQLTTQAAKTITPSTSSQTAVASGVYTTGAITVDAIPSTYVKPTTTKTATTYTPTTSNQTIAAGTYCSGAQTIKGDTNLVAGNIKSGVSIFGITGTLASGGDPFAKSCPFTYTVNEISNASYGFAINSNGYYESQNKRKDDSYAICRVNLVVNDTCDIVFDVINYAESKYDYAVFGALDKALALSNTADSTAKENFKARQSESVVNVIYSGVNVGSHYIDIKFIKDGSRGENNDSVQFKIQDNEPVLPKETINKILAADEDLVAENIRSGVDIFGVTGTLDSDGGTEDGLVTRTLTSYTNNRITTIGDGAFYCYYQLTTVSFPKVTTIGEDAFEKCHSLSSVSFPEVTTIGSYAFHSCYELRTVSFPKVTTICDNAFNYCTSLRTISFPAATTIGSYAFNRTIPITVSFPEVTTIGNHAFCETALNTASFPKVTTIGSFAFFDTNLTTVSFPAATTIGASVFEMCSKLTTVSFPAATTIGSYAFYECYNLISLYLTGSSLCTLSNSGAFTSTPIGGYSKSAGTYGSIYVPASLVTAYKTATNWTYFSSRFVGI